MYVRAKKGVKEEESCIYSKFLSTRSFASKRYEELEVCHSIKSKF